MKEEPTQPGQVAILTVDDGSASNLTFKMNQLYKIQVRIEAGEEFGHVGGDSALKLSH